jgi:hypothetical protein
VDEFLQQTEKYIKDLTHRLVSYKAKEEAQEAAQEAIAEVCTTLFAFPSRCSLSRCSEIIRRQVLPGAYDMCCVSLCPLVDVWLTLLVCAACALQARIAELSEEEVKQRADAAQQERMAANELLSQVENMQGDAQSA